MSRARVAWVIVYAAAMAAVEAAVVVYLRELFPPGSAVHALLPAVPDRLVAIEVGREAATLVMLLAVAALAGRDRWERFLLFAIAFGTWDLGYYAGLRLFIGWPPSLLSWDVLFLIPVPWLGPVLAPVIVSLALVAGSLWLLALKARGATLDFPGWVWAAAVAGAALILLSFMLDYRYAARGAEPPSFRWGLFGAGLTVAAGGLAAGVRRLRGGPHGPILSP